MEKVIEFLETAASAAAFCTALSLTILEAGFLSNVQLIDGAAHIFRIII